MVVRRLGWTHLVPLTSNPCSPQMGVIRQLAILPRLTEGGELKSLRSD